MATRGRPKLTATEKVKVEAKRRSTTTNISVPKEVRDALNDYRAELSKNMGIDLTVAQALKYLISNTTL
jgi:hypothetical protein